MLAGLKRAQQFEFLYFCIFLFFSSFLYFVERRLQLRLFKQAAGLERAEQLQALPQLQYLNAHK